MIASSIADDIRLLEFPPNDPSAPLLITRRASEIEPREVDWLWPGWLPQGMLTLFAGYGGGGKSTVALQIAAAISQGSRLPDGQYAQVGNTLYLAGEDTAEYTLVPRLIAMGANLDRVQIVDGMRQPDDEPGWVSLRQHIGAIEESVRRDRIRLLVIDPVSSFIGDANGDKESDVRGALSPLAKMAERTGCSVLMIRHVSKGGGESGRAASRILGSTAWHDLPRVAWMLGDAPDEHQPDENPEDGTRDVRRVLGVVKSNIAAKPGARWFVQPVDGPMRWLSDLSPVGINDCFAPAIPERSARLEGADAWVRSHLAGGSKPSATLFRDALADGHSEKTVRRALKAVGAISFQLPGKLAGGWHWRLPNGMPETSLPSLASLGHLAGMASDGQVRESEPLNEPYSEEL